MSIPKSTTNGSVVEIPVSQNQASKSLNKHNDSNILSLTSKQLQKQKQRQRQRQKLRSKQLRNKDASNQPLTLKFNVSSNLTSDPVNTGISAPKVSAPKKASSVSHIKPKPKNKTYPSEETYCTCHRPSFGKMIACDDPKCPIEWYHLSCLSIKSAPKGKWICPTCTKRNEAKKNHKKRVT
ncbi:hypothetical protein NADFUDRAFT_22580 [Nadsonia fulvescens var. elongata DSM 6958]|uniref:PHD-type domain-containing protein n=1 Tax=Nadsonia fulvescens var. elongata DSM 6958 TaxID=857566 RepID=A0A1E3PM23_9ASCO|nr:hypothetical protein NADFUDRAFT_22580 [Nadsonia fulvescens var. elongata DSM 6958]